MLAKGVPYNPPTQYLFLDEKRKPGLVKRMRKQITKFDIKPEEVGFYKKQNFSNLNLTLVGMLKKLHKNYQIGNLCIIFA